MQAIITGPPRSGTSFLAGIVARMGLSPGPIEWLRPADKDNKYGYYECGPLMAIDHSILRKFGGEPFDPPDLPANWTQHCGAEKQRILEIVTNNKLEMYKGNMLIVLADLYYEIFPNAKWIIINRAEEDTYRSVCKCSGPEGFPMTTEEYHELNDFWTESWEKSRAAPESLRLDYEDFKKDARGAAESVAKHIGLSLTEERLSSCIEFFMPSNT